jgi:hypothetical protein
MDNVYISNNANTVGALVGALSGEAHIEYCNVTNGHIIAKNDVGGLVGSSNAGYIESCSFRGIVDAGSSVGGLVGDSTSDGAVIIECYSTGAVNGFACVGGLVGQNSFDSLISCSFSKCSVTSDAPTYQTFGGLVGSNSAGGEILISYAQGAVTGGVNCGGLAGRNADAIGGCYSTGLVTGTSNVGGLIGYSDGGSATYSHWDVNSSGCLTSAGGSPHTTEQMYQKATYTSWDFKDYWTICEGTNYPKFQWQESLPGDFTCPDGVDFVDYSVLAKQWMLEKLSYDIAPAGGDGIVNFLDWAVFADSWQGDMIQLSEFMSQWLQRGVYNADIAPVPDGDGVVNTFDFVLFAENWLDE